MYEFYTRTLAGDKKPEEIDSTSSNYVVYIRKNIERYEVEEDDYNPAFKGWKFEEMIIPNNEWLVEELKVQKENNDALMLGLVDLYELQLGEV